VVSVWCRFGVLGRFSGKERAGNLYWTWDLDLYRSVSS